MNWYAMIKRYYDKGFWTDSMVGDAVVLGKITEEQYKEITGQDYVVPDVDPFGLKSEVE